MAFVTALLVAPFAIYVGLDESNQAEVGDCMAGQSASALRIVECTDPDAQWKVLARLEGRTAADHTGSVCRDHPGTAESFFQDGRRFRKGFILCLRTGPQVIWPTGAATAHPGASSPVRPPSPRRRSRGVSCYRAELSSHCVSS